MGNYLRHSAIFIRNQIKFDISAADKVPAEGPKIETRHSIPKQCSLVSFDSQTVKSRSFLFSERCSFAPFYSPKGAVSRLSILETVESRAFLLSEWCSLAPFYYPNGGVSCLSVFKCRWLSESATINPKPRTLDPKFNARNPTPYTRNLNAPLYFQSI